MGLGCRRGGGALERLQRSKNSANESCVAASANVAGIALHVTSRVGPGRTCELILSSFGHESWSGERKEQQWKHPDM